MIRWLRTNIRRSRRYIGLHPTRSLLQSFNYAFEGIIHVLATQRNMRIHVLATFVALGACVWWGVSRVDLMLVLFAASLVIITEMINTAVESAVDMSTRTYNPLAKVAKDVAAGAVLVAAMNAVIVGYLVFGWRIGDRSDAALDAIRTAPVHLTIIILLATFFGTVALKALTGQRGTPLSGGFPSGHSAIAFAVWMSVTLIMFEQGFVYATLVSVLTFVLALLVSHTRVESGIHTGIEVVAGALFGSAVALLIFQLAWL